MELKKKHATDLHHEYLEWIEKFKFYEEEMVRMRTHLSELMANNTATEVQSTGEQLLNRLDIQRNHLQTIKDHLRHQERIIAHEVKANPTQYKHVLTPEDEVKQAEIGYFEKSFPELREEVREFQSKYL